MSSFETIIGLEVHVQLNTKTKIFCSCATSFGDKPNTNVCPVCLGLPGALPVLNREAVKKAISFGTAINAVINQNSVFARKNYFYPDLPKAYQISQFEIPIVGKGNIEIEVNGIIKNIGITRAHLEEDAGKNIHDGNISKVDLNRACTPLLEIVSEPDIRSSDEAIAYLKKLHSIVRFLEISDANMQEGSFRCDANVSIRPKGETQFYTRVEIKNLNSFKFIQKAIEYEVQRQCNAFESGVYAQEVVQETRLFDTQKGITKSMRGKEESADYRYFNDPDLLPVFLDPVLLDEGKKIPELPDSKIKRYTEVLDIKENDAKVITQDIECVKYFEFLVEKKIQPKVACTWLIVELQGRLKNGNTLANCGITKENLYILLLRLQEQKISGAGAKVLLTNLVENRGGNIDSLIKELGLEQINDDDSIIKVIDEILSNNADKVAEYKEGKEKMLGFFVGQVMKQSRGINPQKVNSLLKARLQQN
ncbi:Asp-tRNA(Asn)/Glu-tRNA(Gln) amidotransferase subunit GatB [Helicobacter sp. MIT 14-3879]|uniref:Asp-tRNA(Asn)/Glu-tRNA(Gln) amidotransferase subunit GatB n=1 Tax=Helicobacter sp. MIT 14-3879 TaxID=2040649 RepID=UPI000E1F65E4|nr:Asp-tRNA(Asn)/Glu-tRNA(Gln) amidotransferase subunit GatB [Helicobacter sp. MIT 14-3879]RDU61324.1 Asp-tRNA(Asn)/Glu-tRNA(Gln) amidotransferase GatCAB subunit B [Helicobacter sp. MIT 14-3879]